MHADPVIAFQQLTPEEMLDAVEASGIRCDGRFLALNSYENRVYRIGVEEAEPIVAKFYRPDRWSDQVILEEHAFTAELAAEEIPVIAPLANASEGSLHRFGAFRFALYPCQGGRAPELDNPRQLEMLGRFIGRIHGQGRLEPYRHRPEISIQAYAIKPSEFLLANDFIPPHLTETWTSLIGVLQQQMAFSIERAGQVRFIRLHGDLHHGNVLWTDDGPHIVDFDDARTGLAV